MRRCVLVAVMTALFVVPAAASAAPITSVFAGRTVSGQPIPCTPQSDGVRVCHGTDNGTTGPDLRLKSFDGSPLEVYVILPPAPSSGSDGPYPLISQSHGWGSSAGGPNNTEFYGPTADSLAKTGYAVIQLTARGFGDSCGKAAQQAESPAYYQLVCSNGYIRLDDERYEAHDVQWAIGLLVDQGIAAPGEIGVTGESYGGGVSLELATLKDRVMNPDGSLSPWTSPGGTPLSITASAPVIPWSDLAYSLMPNGRTLDYAVTSSTADLSPIGVEKQSFVSGLYALGQSTGYYAPPGTNSQADLTTWYGLINAGEPYDSNPEAATIVHQIADYHSAYYLLNGSEAPAPLLIANGFTDDLFPVDEALRYYNRERSLYPSDPIELIDGDFGHQRAANKPGDKALLSSAIQRFFDYFLKPVAPGAGTRAQPPTGATATIETCPTTAPSGGPYTASTWAGLHPGEVDYRSNPLQTIVSGAGDPTIAKTVDPILAGNPCGTASGSDQGPGVATYRLPAARGAGYTLLGSPTVIANLAVTGSFAFIAARLWDVNPSTNTETLVARGIYRIDSNNPDGLQVFQLHPGAWHFAAGHVPKLELLGQDAPYARTSNGQFSIQVTNLQLRLPVHELPGSVPGVGKPLAPVNSQAHPASCSTRPYSNLNKRRVHASPHLLVASGSAGEPQCAVTTAAARRRQHVAHVYVMIYKPAAHGHCRFVKRSGRLTRPRSCRRPIEFRAVGRARWHVRLRIHLAPGVYLVRSDAVDGNHRHQRRTGASVKRVRVRRIVRARHASAASRPATATARPATATALRPNFLG